MPETFTLAIDVGNTRIKFGVFENAATKASTPELPVCRATLALPVTEELDWGKIATHFEAWRSNLACGVVAGANPGGVARVISGWPSKFRPPPVTVQRAAELPLRVNVDSPDKVGIDRLLDAVAANALRRPGEPVVVVDAGTATTVNYLSADGVFEGGAILPGLELGARALHQYTALLPQIDIQSLVLNPVAPLGRDTPAAISSGLWFGQIGAIRELVARLTESADLAPGVTATGVMVTGGNGRALAAALGEQARFEPDLALRGLAFVAQTRESRASRISKVAND